MAKHRKVRISRRGFVAGSTALAAGTLAGVALTYLTSARAEPLATEPFDIPAAMGGVPPLGI